MDTKEIKWQASFLLEEPEIKREAEFVLREAGRAARIIKICVVALLVIAFILGIFFFQTELSGDIALLSLCALVLIALIIEPFLIVKKTVKMAMEERKEAVLKGKEEGISFKSGDGQHTFKWEEIVVTELEEIFVLHLPTGLIMAAPFRALDEVGMEDLRSHAIAKKDFHRATKIRR